MADEARKYECSECHDEDVAISVTTLVTVNIDQSGGIVDEVGEPWPEDGDPAHCAACGFAATLGEFKVAALEPTEMGDKS